MKNKKSFYESFKKKLVDIRDTHSKKLKDMSSELVKETSGDVGDHARALQEETMSLAQRNKLLQEVHEIDLALNRIKQGTFGVCEETGTEIEDKRLNAIPWTRLSLEGAEIREIEQRDQEEFG